QCFRRLSRPRLRGIIMTESISELSVIELSERVQSGALSAVTVAQQTLEAIAKRADLNAFTHVAAESALAQARALEERRTQGKPLGRLAGVTVAVKDAICTHDQPTTCGSRILMRHPDSASRDGWRPPYDATVVDRLRAEG